MSKFKKIAVEFSTAKSIIKTLKEVFGEGAVRIAQNTKENTLTIEGYSRESRKVTIAVNKSDVGKVIPHAYAGLGFAYNNGKYEAIVDDYDFTAMNYNEVWQKVKQGYSYHELTRQARARGYSVRRQKTTDGNLRVQLVRA